MTSTVTVDGLQSMSDQSESLTSSSSSRIEENDCVTSKKNNDCFDYAYNFDEKNEYDLNEEEEAESDGEDDQNAEYYDERTLLAHDNSTSVLNGGNG